jgi:hypothetical protein
MQSLMQTWKDGKEPKVGPQNGRINSCGIQGRTSLFDFETPVHTRDFEKEKEVYAAAKAAAAAAAAVAKK